MSNPEALESWTIEKLGFQSKTCSLLRASGIQTVGDLLASDPGPLVARSRTWSDIAATLTRLEKRYPGEPSDRIAAYLETGGAAAEQRAATVQERPVPDLPPNLAPAYRELRSGAHPIALRQLVRRLKVQASEIRDQLQSPPFLIYPFGLHRWVGLREWGQEGYRKAARSAWNVLPLHLQRVSLKGETLPTEAWKAIQDVAQERQDVELFAAALEAIADVDVDVAIASPTEGQAPRESSDSVLTAGATPVPDTPTEADEEVLPEPPIVVAAPVSPALVAETAPSYQTELPDLFREALEKTKPVIFKGLEGGDILGGANVLVKASSRWRSPFSLVELGPSLGDFRWLTRWAKDLTYVEAQRWLNSIHPVKCVGSSLWSGRECFGAILLFLCCELGRRLAREGQIWEQIPEHFASATRSELFVGTQPRAVTRQAIELGARRLNVRHAFGEAGSHAWYQTIYLQFGFTHTGVQSLPVWLGSLDHAPSAVARLHEESATFRELWCALQSYRAKRTSAQTLSAELKSNPYVLDRWVEEILAVAQTDLQRAPQLALDGEIPVMAPRLVWAPATRPVFHLTWRGVESLGLEESGYDVYVEGQRQGRVFLDESGYRCEPANLEVPLKSPYVTVELEGDEGSHEHEIDLILWDNDDEYQLFDGESGNRVFEDKPLSSKRELFVLAKEGLELEPPAAEAFILPDGSRLFRLLTGWKPTTIVSRSGPIAELTTKAQPSGLDSCCLEEIHGLVSLGDYVDVSLKGLPREAEVVSARAFGAAVKFERSTLAWSAKVRIDESVCTSALPVRFVVSYEGGRYSFQRSAKLHLQDVSIRLRSEGRWKRFRELANLTTKELERATVRFLLNEEHSRYALMAGQTYLKKPPARMSRLNLRGGYGEALQLQEGRYNCLQRPLVLCREYVDPGILLGVGWRSDGRFEVYLEHTLEARSSHFLLFWNGLGETRVIRPRELTEARGSCWRGEIPRFPGPVCVCLGHEGVCLGTAYTIDFEPDTERGDPRQIAGLLRWTKLPVLGQRWAQKVTDFASRTVNHCMAAWIFDRKVQGIDLPLLLEETLEWNGVIRALYNGLSLGKDKFVELWSCLLKYKPTDSADEDHFLTMLSVLPLPALRMCPHILDNEQKGEVVKALIGCKPTEPDLDKKLSDLVDSAAGEMKVNPHFLRGLLTRVRNKDIEGLRENLEMALQNHEFASYFAGALIAGWANLEKVDDAKNKKAPSKGGGLKWRISPKT